MLDWLGVTSTVSFCQLSEGVCYPPNQMHKFHASCSPMAHMMCVNYAFCIIFG